jgi:hypothetical protein
MQFIKSGNLLYINMILNKQIRIDIFLLILYLIKTEHWETKKVNSDVYVSIWGIDCLYDFLIRF